MCCSRLVPRFLPDLAPPIGSQMTPRLAPRRVIAVWLQDWLLNGVPQMGVPQYRNPIWDPIWGAPSGSQSAVPPFWNQSGEPPSIWEPYWSQSGVPYLGANLDTLSRSQSGAPLSGNQSGAPQISSQMGRPRLAPSVSLIGAILELIWGAPSESKSGHLI